MKHYSYQNSLVNKKELRQLLAWTFTHYDSIQASNLADALKHLGFHYATQAGISISIEDLRVPVTKDSMLTEANQEILEVEKLYLQGKMTAVERFQKTIDTWNLTSDSVKQQVVYYFKTYDPLNSVYLMAFSGARGNLSQVRQLVGMRGLMANTNGEIMNLAIQQNFREGLSITDYLMSGYGARKGIVDTALKTANSGYLTRRLIDVSQDILIREKNCWTDRSLSIFLSPSKPKTNLYLYQKLLGHVIAKPLYHPETKALLIKSNSILTPELIQKCQENQIDQVYIRSPLTCQLYRAICQICYGWNLANQNLVDMGEAIGILAGQSIGEPGTQLTMRTFHTGGVFTSQAREQITSPCTGIIKFSKLLKTRVFRSNQGTDVFITKNSGSLIVVTQDPTQAFVKIDVSKNTIIFPTHNQYILKDTVIAEIINQNKQIRTEIKPILSPNAGEIVMPRFQKKVNVFPFHQLLWILAGKFYSSPTYSFLNLYSDYHINPSSFIFRSKILTPSNGWVESINPNQNLYQGFLKLRYTSYVLRDCKLRKFQDSQKSHHYFLELEKFPYLLRATSYETKVYLEISRNQQIATYLTNRFTTLTGGTVYYDYIQGWKDNPLQQPISYSYAGFRESRLYFAPGRPEQMAQISSTSLARSVEELVQKLGPSFLPTDEAAPDVSYRTMVWLGEEVHVVNCEASALLVENGDFISANFELMPGLCSKTSGIVSLQLKNNWIESICIHSGVAYQSQELTTSSQTLYYPGEKILSKVKVSHLSLCEDGLGKRMDQWLVRPLELFEVSYRTQNRISSQTKGNPDSPFRLESISSYNYSSTQILHGSQNVNLVSNLLILTSSHAFPSTTKMELCPIPQRSEIELTLREKLDFNQYLPPKLRYKQIQSAVLMQAHQFMDQYTILAYLEALTKDGLQVVKLKVKETDPSEKQILLISNEDCVTVPKNQFPTKELDDFILESPALPQMGRIIIENSKIFTVQKGQLYFFPNCPQEEEKPNQPIEFKLVSIPARTETLEEDQMKGITRYDYRKVQSKLIPEPWQEEKKEDDRTATKGKKKIFNQLVWKKDGKLYNSLLPGLYQAFAISNSSTDTDWCSHIPPSTKIHKPYPRLSYPGFPFRIQTLFVSPSTRRNPKAKPTINRPAAFGFVYFIEHHSLKENRAFGLSCLTENYLEQEVNRLFCKNGEFIDKGETLGLLNLEKEITGDIVQGLPKIENVLEARKNPVQRKRIPMVQKKGFLVQKTSLDQNFDFRKIGTSIQEKDKINAHKLLNVYFAYYLQRFGFLSIAEEVERPEKGLRGPELEMETNQPGSLTLGRLYNMMEKRRKREWYRNSLDYESSYRSFKQVQSFILNSVQAIYDQQGVLIHDKHLEVIIKQMTAKVIILDEGMTPLLIDEVVDLYHLHRMNQTMLDLASNPKPTNFDRLGNLRPAQYRPFLIGITNSALNNPSFISAASFQETTRVLTKAAIDGRMDWLRGLKENIATGHFLPAGTAFQSYHNSFSGSVWGAESPFDRMQAFLYQRFQTNPYCSIFLEIHRKLYEKDGNRRRDSAQATINSKEKKPI